MSYATAMARATEIRTKLGIENPLRTGQSNAFKEVLANAVNRFEEGPTRISNPSSAAGADAQGTWGSGVNVVPATVNAQGGSASAGLASPGYSTPKRVHGWSPELKQMIQSASDRFGVPKELITAVSRAESAFRSEVKSPAGATGLMQLMPATAKGLGVTDVTDPWQNLAGGTKYLRQLMDRFKGDVTKVIAGYNAGPNAVQQYGGIPPYSETKTYVARVLDYAEELGWRP